MHSSVAGQHSTKSAGKRRLAVRLMCGGRLLLVATCKAALVLAALEASAETLEPESVETVDVVMAALPQGSGQSQRSAGGKSFSMCSPPCDSVLDGQRATQPKRSSRAAGHRLPNGLCAPMRR